MFWNKLFRKKNKKENTSELIESGNVKAVVLSDLGNIRTNNEDVGMFYRIAEEDITREKGYLLIVADGMGGHKAGEVASKMATEIISQEYFKKNGNGSIEKTLYKAFSTANRKIYELASSQKAYHGMGTTCSAFVVTGDAVYYAHVGDSRGYFLKNNLITRITEDHTYVQELVNKGEITTKEADTHPKRNILTNAMGTKPDLRIDTGKCAYSFENDDRLMLCSDGLYDYIHENELADILNNKPLQEAAEYMIREAKKRGGHDNITVVLAEKTETAIASAPKETRDVELPQTKEYDLP
jgi:serine/threonine protein phosphatase PrpC